MIITGLVRRVPSIDTFSVLSEAKRDEPRCLLRMKCRVSRVRDGENFMLKVSRHKLVEFKNV